jgi:predicted ATPase
VFGLAATGEADVVHALHTALGLARELGPAVRIGVDTGVIVAPNPPGSDLQSIGGEALQIAGRLRESARPGTALVSERSWRSARAQFRFGPAIPRGRHGEIGVVAREVRSVEPSAPIRPWPNVPMVGRSAELNALVALADEVAVRRRPRLVNVVGSVGVGKSRLVAEAVLAVRERRPDFQVWRGRCLSVGQGTTRSALGDILRQACSINLGEPPDHIEARLRVRLGDLLAPLALSNEDAASTIAGLAATAGLTNRDDPLTVLGPLAAAAERTRAWARFVTAIVSTRPAVFLIEDLHWAGDQFVDIIEHLATHADGPLMVVTTARPELYDWRPGFGNRGDASTIALRELTLAASRELLDLLPPAAVLDPRQRQLVLDRADGNPYFLEELLAHVTESDTAFLPDTLRAVLAARVDALDHDERIVLQEASVIGRTFWSAALAQNQPGLAVADALRRLERRHLIFARPVSSIDGGGDEYLFHHALLRDAAYAGLPDTHRIEAHVATARWLEQRLAASDELTELIAFHYASAAEIGPRSVEDREPIRIRAVTGLVAAGASARRRFDIAHAQDLHARALALATTEIERLGIYEELGDDAADGLQGDSARRWYEQALTGARLPANGSADRSRLCRKLASLMTSVPSTPRIGSESL